MSKSKTTILKQPDEKSWVRTKFEEAVDFTNYKALPFLAKAIILAGFVFSLVTVLADYSNLIPQVQGALCVVIAASVLKAASQRR